MSTSYYSNVDIDNMTPDQRDYHLRLVEFGVTPNQIFNKPFPKRKPRDLSEKPSGSLTTKVDTGLIVGHRKIIYMSLKDNVVTMLFDNGDAENVKISYFFLTGSFTSDKSKFAHGYAYQNSLAFLQETNKARFNSNAGKIPIIIYNNGTIIAEGGYPNGQIVVCTTERSISPNYIFAPNDTSVITALDINKDETVAIAGNEIGVIYLFFVNKDEWYFSRRICAHFLSIIGLNINNDLNVFSTCSSDEFINIYTLPTGKLVHSLKIEKPLFAFIASKPLGVYIIYSEEKKKLISYSLNGSELFSTDEEIPRHPRLFEDLCQNEFLLYYAKGRVVIRNIPYLEEVYNSTIFLKEEETLYTDINVEKRMIYITDGDGRYVTVLRNVKINN